MFNDPRLVLMIPAQDIEQGAISQIAQVLGVKVMEKMVIFPDVHQGYDIPIGSAVVIKDHIWPGAVGVDINCGMCHISTGKTLAELNLTNKKQRKMLFDDLKEFIPTSFNCSKISTDFPEFLNHAKDDKLYDLVMSKMTNQIGTLGGGNHFCNIGINEDRTVGVTLHTGSRYAGNQIGKYWMKRAKSDGTNHNGLYMYNMESDEGPAYLNDMQWAFRYADKNREVIMRNVMTLLGLKFDDYKKEMINETHNHAIHMGEGRFLHRKGATPAENGVKGIIPGNMFDGVFVTEGLGNIGYLSSASHGAGRLMSRTKAKKTIKIEEVRAKLEENDILVDIDKNNVDEAPAAYKNIFGVIKAQDGVVVKVLDRFVPFIVHIG